MPEAGGFVRSSQSRQCQAVSHACASTRLRSRAPIFVHRRIGRLCRGSLCAVADQGHRRGSHETPPADSMAARIHLASLLPEPVPAPSVRDLRARAATRPARGVGRGARGLRRHGAQCRAGGARRAFAHRRHAACAGGRGAARTAGCRTPQRPSSQPRHWPCGCRTPSSSRGSSRRDYSLDHVRRGQPIPALQIDRVPADLAAVKDGNERKWLFIKAPLPIVLQANGASSPNATSSCACVMSPRPAESSVSASGCGWPTSPSVTAAIPATSPRCCSGSTSCRRRWRSPRRASRAAGARPMPRASAIRCSARSKPAAATRWRCRGRRARRCRSLSPTSPHRSRRTS